MKKNIDTTGRVFRIIVALIAAYLGYTISEWFYILTVIALLTALSGVCPLYDLKKIKITKKK